MPTYEYQCPEGHAFELFQKMSDRPRAKCPSCGRVATRKISAGAGLHFKGSGFYITDYGKDGKGPAKAPEKSEAKTESKPETSAKGETPKAPAPKPEKPAAKKAKE